MTPVELVLSKLPDAKRNGKGWAARCPAHDDNRPSLSVAKSDAGGALVHCHAGCTPEAIVAGLGLKLADLMPAQAEPIRRPAPKVAHNAGGVFATAAAAVAALERRHGPRDALWTYRNAGGEPVGVVVRWNLPSGDKDVRPVSWRAGALGGWTISAMPSPRPLYCLPDLLARPGERVHVGEGEKCADALARLGLLATTSAGGATAAKQSDWTPLVGRDVVIVPDEDKAGGQYAADVAEILTSLTPPARVRVVRLRDTWPDLPDGGDIADVVEAGEDLNTIKAKLVALADAAQTGPPERPAPAEPYAPVLVRLADVKPEPIRWLWPGRIALGKLTLIAGDPGLGKSFITLDMAARLSRGTGWPDQLAVAGPRGGVVLLSAEDDLADTIRPRLDAARADVSRIVALRAVQVPDPETGGERSMSFTLSSDLPALERAIDETPDCKLVIIDPISAYLGGGPRFDSHRNTDVRAVLAPLAELAGRRGVAVVAVTHLRKGEGPAMYRAMGSLAFVAAARGVWAVARDKDDPTDRRRLFLSVKNNIAGNRDGLAFTLHDAAGGVPCVAWNPEPVSVPVDDALAPKSGWGGKRKPGPESEARKLAAEWLRELLKTGPMKSTQVRDEGRAAGYCWRTLHRAKDDLGIRPYRERFGGGWMWKLPKAPTGLSCQVPQETKNLASWHDSKSPDKTGGSEPDALLSCQDDLSWHDSKNPEIGGKYERPGPPAPTEPPTAGPGTGCVDARERDGGDWGEV